MSDFKPEEIQRQFPILSRKVTGGNPCYLDNACMTLMPERVADAMNRFYNRHISCHGRTNHLFGIETTREFDKARERMACFLGAADPREIVFVRNTTEAINIVSAGFSFKQGDRVLTSDMEHNSNLVPWLRQAETGRIVLDSFPLDSSGRFEPDSFEAALAEKPRLVSVFHTSNVTGVTLPISEISARVHEAGALLLLDAAQAMTTGSLNVVRDGIDFLACSLHKAFGPTGIGVLYGRLELLEELRPLLGGGEMVVETTRSGYSLAEVPTRFEAGLQNYAGVIGAGAALDFIEELGQPAVREHAEELNRLAQEQLTGCPGVAVLGPDDAEERGTILNLRVEGVDPFKMGEVLSLTEGIMVRAGHQCAHSWYHARGLGPSLRASFAPYNSRDDVNRFCRALTRFQKILGKDAS